MLGPARSGVGVDRDPIAGRLAEANVEAVLQRCRSERVSIRDIEGRRGNADLL